MFHGNQVADQVQLVQQLHVENATINYTHALQVVMLLVICMCYAKSKNLMIRWGAQFLSWRSLAECGTVFVFVRNSVVFFLESDAFDL